MFTRKSIVYSKKSIVYSTPVTRVSCQGSGKLLIKVFCASYYGNQDIYQEEKMYTCKDYFMPAKKNFEYFAEG